MRFLGRFVGTSILALALCTGCGGGEAAKSKVTPQEYDAVWEELLHNMKSKKLAKKFTDEVLKKHNLTDKEWEEACLQFGAMPPKVKAEYDKMMGGNKVPDGKNIPLPK
jgi:hypothetical protein